MRSEDALALRSVALSLLPALFAGPSNPESAARPSVPGPDGTRSPPRPDGWRLFLAAERCGRPLHRALRARGTSEWSPAPQRDVLAERVALETQQVLRCRAGLRELDRVGSRLGVRPVVLKGGVDAAREEDAVALADLDVLLPPPAAEALWRALRDEGRRPGGLRTANPLPILAAEGRASIEVHDRLPAFPDGIDGVLARARSLPAGEALRRPAPADHLWHLLHHTTIEALDRRGRLRDLVTIARALSDGVDPDGDTSAHGPDGVLAEVERRVGRHPRAGVLRDQLEMARALAAGRAPEDRFRAQAASYYLLRGVLERWGYPKMTGAWLVESAAAWHGAPEDRRRLRRERLAWPETPPWRGWLRVIHRRAPGAGRALRWTMRAPGHGLLSAAGRAAAAWGRRVADGG